MSVAPPARRVQASLVQGPLTLLLASATGLVAPSEEKTNPKTKSLDATPRKRSEQNIIYSFIVPSLACSYGEPLLRETEWRS